MKEAEPTARELAAGLGHAKRGRIQVGPPEERTYSGIIFASKHEMENWKKLLPLLHRGVFVDLKRQIVYPLHVVNRTGCKIRVTSYRADFVAVDREGKTTVYDAKGMITERYKLLRRWMEIEYGIKILEL